MKVDIRKTLHLAKRDTILTAWCEPVSGPGWSNRPLWVIVQDGDGKLRRECLQPKEQPAGVARLYSICAEAHRELMGALGMTR